MTSSCAVAPARIMRAFSTRVRPSPTQLFWLETTVPERLDLADDDMPPLTTRYWIVR